MRFEIWIFCMNIILTGYRGSGKTTVGKILAKKLKRPFLDMDDIIEKQEDRKIREIFQKDGWQKFRQIEKKQVQQICSSVNNAVIAIGGGTLMYDENLCLTHDAKVVLLTAPLEILVERIVDDPSRPPLTKSQSSVEEIKKIWNERKDRYFKVADIIIDTGNGDAEKTAEEIKRQLFDKS